MADLATVKNYELDKLIKTITVEELKLNPPRLNNFLLVWSRFKFKFESNLKHVYSTYTPRQFDLLNYFENKCVFGSTDLPSPSENGSYFDSR